MSYQFRKDVRTDEKFEEDMDENHTEEAKILAHFNDLINKSAIRGELTPHGVSADGAVKDDAKPKQIALSDAILTLGKNTYNIEIHHVNFNKMATYKAGQLSRYSKSKYYILMYCRTAGKGKDFEIGDNVEIHLLGKSTLKALLDITPNFKHKSFGYKPCIRLVGKKFDAIYSSPFQMSEFTPKKFKEWLAKRLKEESYEES